MMSYLLLNELKPTERTKKIPQSRTVFAVTLQVHPELLDMIIPLWRQEVKGYYFELFFRREEISPGRFYQVLLNELFFVVVRQGRKKVLVNTVLMAYSCCIAAPF